MLSKDSLLDELLRNPFGGPREIVPELLFEKKGLIPALQQLFVSHSDPSPLELAELCSITATCSKSQVSVPKVTL
jgi:hypothetical protein